MFDIKADLSMFFQENYDRINSALKGGVSMESKILDGKKVAKTLFKQMSNQVRRLELEDISLQIAIIHFDNSHDVVLYNRQIQKRGRVLGIEVNIIALSSDITFEALQQTIITLNHNRDIHGIMIQHPIPRHLSFYQVASLVDPIKDLDGIHPENLGRLIHGDMRFLPGTCLGILNLFHAYQLTWEGKNVVILGASNHLSKPLSMLLSHKKATVTLIQRSTPNRQVYLQMADIIISAIGQGHFLQEISTEKAPIVVDIGINTSNDGQIIGDIHPQVWEQAAYYTPVPGGVGPMTVAALFEQSLKALSLQLDSSLDVMNEEADKSC